MPARPAAAAADRWPRARSRLTPTGRAGGTLDLCQAAAGVRRLLTTEPPEKRVCTQIYGGPQTARVTGTLAGRPVDRRFNRENGCRIAEWDRLQRAGLLPGP